MFFLYAACRTPYDCSYANRRFSIEKWKKILAGSDELIDDHLHLTHEDVEFDGVDEKQQQQIKKQLSLFYYYLRQYPSPHPQHTNIGYLDTTLATEDVQIRWVNRSILDNEAGWEPTLEAKVMHYFGAGYVGPGNIALPQPNIPLVMKTRVYVAAEDFPISMWFVVFGSYN